MSISYWLDESSSACLSPSVTNRFDVAVIGAGIAGLSAAYWLEKKDPNLRIAVIEKHSLGAGASGRNAGFVTCGSAEHFQKLVTRFGLAKASEIWKFSETNRELVLQEIIQEESSSVDFFKTGSCTVASSPQDWQRYQALHQQMRGAGIEVDLIDEKYLSAHYGVRVSAGAIQYAHDGIVHPLKLLQKIKSKLKQTTFFCGEEVFQLQAQGEALSLRTQKNQFSVGQVFVCLNGFVSQLLPELKKFILPQRGQVVVTGAVPAFVKGPCYLTQHLCYFRQLPTGELLVGGFRNHDEDAENTIADEVSEKIQTALSDFVKNYFRQPYELKINYRWSGVMGFTEDGQMLIGAHPKLQHVHLMAGCSGHGMGLSFNAARVMVENAFGKALPRHLDLKRVSLI